MSESTKKRAPRRKPAVVAEPVHEATVRKIGPGAYRAECSLNGAMHWAGDLREGHWWEAKAAAEDDAAVHAGREPRSRAKGPTAARPMRISDVLWAAIVQVAEDEGLTASEVGRQAMAADPRVAAKLEAVSA